MAELEAQFLDIRFMTKGVHDQPLAFIEFTTESEILIDKLGGVQKLAVQLDRKSLDYLHDLPEGKITIGVSDYSKGASRKTAGSEALKLKKILVRHCPC